MAWVQGLMDNVQGRKVVTVVPCEIPSELLSPGAWQMCWSWALCQQNPPLVPFPKCGHSLGQGELRAQCPVVNWKGLPWLVSLAVGWLQDVVAPPELPKVF